MARVDGKAMTWVTCQDAKAKCKQPGEKRREKKVHWRKQAAEELPKGKKKAKKVQRETETGLSRGAALEGQQTSSKIVKNLSNLMRGLLWRLDRQNALLAQLVQLKAEKVWHAEMSEESRLDDEIEHELELLNVKKVEEQTKEMVALQVQVDVDAKRAVEAMEESEELETGGDNKEEEEMSDSMV